MEVDEERACEKAPQETLLEAARSFTGGSPEWQRSDASECGCMLAGPNLAAKRNFGRSETFK
jgi:hypothetical protein